MVIFSVNVGNEGLTVHSPCLNFLIFRRIVRSKTIYILSKGSILVCKKPQCIYETGEEMHTHHRTEEEMNLSGKFVASNIQ